MSSPPPRDSVCPRSCTDNEISPSRSTDNTHKYMAFQEKDRSDTIKVLPRKPKSAKARSRSGTPSQDDYEPQLEDEASETSDLSDLPDSDTDDAVAGHRRPPAKGRAPPSKKGKELGSALPPNKGQELAARYIKALRETLEPGQWFRIEPISRGESEKIVAANSKKRRTGFRILAGKVLFGRMRLEELGLLNVWATVRIHQSRIVHGGRNAWATFLYNDGDYGQVAAPSAPSEHVQVEPIFALLWREKKVPRELRVHADRVGVCIRVALINAGYSDGGGFRSRWRHGVNEGFMRAIRDNLAAKQQETAVPDLGGLKDLPFDLTVTDDSQIRRPAPATDTSFNKLGQRPGQLPTVSRSVTSGGTKKRRLDEEVQMATPVPRIQAPSQPAANASQNPAALRTALETKVSKLEQANTSLTNRVNDQEQRLRTQAKAHVEQLRDQNARFEEQLRVRANSYDKQLRLRAKLKDEELQTFAKEYAEQAQGLTSERDDLKEKYDTLQHANARLREHNAELLTENHELLVQIDSLSKQQGREKSLPSREDPDNKKLRDRISKLSKENESLRSRNKQLIDEKLASLNARMEENTDSDEE
ncbi:hypothetical protein EK21DRAFT_116532 [Setomelanomma holmii]|uniref:Uncharacterized protein n=1 Tax=Setomelanomma holmii TaxID=210430 RepID=A0A9P4GZY1_9PLEO|nr:hypothetical protein EK21DRAFT_116532 [Setomelanomma holmii]